MRAIGKVGRGERAVVVRRVATRGAAARLGGGGGVRYKDGWKGVECRCFEARRCDGIWASVQGRYASSRATTTTTTPFLRPLHDKILIANRGEVACRIIRTAKRLGVKTVAIYSEADAEALHVKMADEAYCVGPALSSESYLRADKIIEICKKSGATAVHPGWGFLSENADFADALEKEKIEFIGPPSDAIRAMGSKSESKDIMLAAGVPCVPGYHGTNQDEIFLHRKADEIGYPVLIKAIKGGGGKGMRVVHSTKDFQENLGSAKREAIKSFNDEAVLIEKYVTKPRHVEVQVFADKQGNTVHLFERDCSIQRRHQKVIEEAPAPGLTENQRQAIGGMAVKAAKAVGYVGAGTVETLYDEAEKKFYFMEMNTRLQVEHPVTEMITGQDLVEWQLSIAAGNVLPCKQSELHATGHAFEARIYAEHPRGGFLPDVGPLVYVKTPPESSHLRLETGFVQGDEISVHYDPMISKLVVWGPDRLSALRRFLRALEQYEIVGLSTNIEFLKSVASHKAFQAGQVETGFIPKYETDLFPPLESPSSEVIALAALSIALRSQAKTIQSAFGSAEPFSPFAHLGGLRVGSAERKSERKLGFTHAISPTQAQSHTVVIKSEDLGRYDLIIEDNHAKQKTSFYNVEPSQTGGTISAHLNTRFVSASVIPVAKDPADASLAHLEQIDIFIDGKQTTLEIPTPGYLLKARGSNLSSSANVKTPMPCKVVSVAVAPGDVVKAGQILIILEAMKMEHSIRAPTDGKLTKVMCKVGDVFPEGKTLVEFETPEASASVGEEDSMPQAAHQVAAL